MMKFIKSGLVRKNKIIIFIANIEISIMLPDKGAL